MIKRILVTILAVALICPVIGHFDVVTISADGAYKVKYIEDDGDLTTVASYDNFNDAKIKMAENEDYVVTCDASLSPYEIIAMNSGLVYSYPARKNSKITDLYEKVDDKLNGYGTKICVSSNYEMTYHETYSTQYSSSKGYQMGWVKVTLNGFTGYIDLEYCDLVPTKYIKNGIAITLGGWPSSSFSVVCKQKYYTAEVNGNYTDLVLHYYLGMPSSSSKNAYGYSLHIGVAPSFMEKDVKYYSNDGINFYTDTALSKLAGTYYNYYQFVPARSYSSISGDTLDAYLASKGYKNTSDSVMYGTGNDFIKDQTKYGVNGAMIYAMAIHESGYGTSDISKGKYNLFGWGAFDNNVSEATRYESVYECVKSQMADNLSNYLDESSRNYYYSMGLGNKGGGFSLKYASDPYWPEKIAQHYYAIDKFSKGNNGELTDYNVETLALVTTTGAKVYKSDSESSGYWYTTENKGSTSYQKNLITIVLEKGTTFTKVRTSNNIDENGLLKPIEMPAGYIAPYNASTSIGYIKNSDLEYINNGTKALETTYKQKDVDESTLTSSATISTITLNNTTLSLDGMAFLKGVDFDYSPIISHKLVLKNLQTGNTAEFDLTTSEREGFTLNDGFTYKYVNFAGTCDVSELIDGQFTLSIKVTNGKYSREIQLASSANKFANVTSNVSNTTYRVYQDERYGYRLELEKFSSVLDYSAISKPSIRKSFFNLLDGFTLTSVGEDNANLSLNAASMIYYCNYNDASTVNYVVYLIKDATNYLALETNIVEKPEGYGANLSQTYDTTNIAYLASGEIGTLQQGTYDIVVKITNGSYVDYVNAFTYGTFNPNTLQVGTKTYSLEKNTTNNKIQLIISESQTGGQGE